MFSQSYILAAVLGVTLGLGCSPHRAAPGAKPDRPSAEAEVVSPVLREAPTFVGPPREMVERSVEDTALQVVEVDAPDTPALREVDEPVATYALRRGESLAHFARWAELPVEVIADESGLGLAEPLAVGTEIRVPADHARRSRIETGRDAHHVRRAEGYLESRGGAVGTDFYVVRTGDTAWDIAKQHGDLPVWILETFNPSLDLEDLRPGQAVMYPRTADTAAEDVESGGPLADAGE